MARRAFAVMNVWVSMVMLNFEAANVVALRALKLAVQRGENTAYRFEQQGKLAFKALADDDKLGPQFDALLKKVRDGLTLQ